MKDCSNCHKGTDTILECLDYCNSDMDCPIWEPMTNGDIIRNFTDEQLRNFLWTFKINTLVMFMETGFEKGMNAKELAEWLQKTDFICDDTRVSEDFVYDQSFNLKEGAMND